MKIVSIYNGHNANIGVFINGECKSIMHEEKFNNQKNYTGFPYNSIKDIDNRFTLTSFDNVVFCYETQFKQYLPTEVSIEDFDKNQKKSIEFFEYVRYVYRIIPKYITKTLRKIFILFTNEKYWKIVFNYMEKNYNISESKIKYFNHHLLHCMTPVYFYGLNKQKSKVLLISIDGSGDGLSSKIVIYNPTNNQLKEVSSTDYSASIGGIYGAVTKFLGMKIAEHEYKVMGLAAYVNNFNYYKHIYDKLREIIWIDKENLKVVSKIDSHAFEFYLRKNFCGERFDNIAAAVQRLTEDLVIEYIKASIQKTGVDNIALSGGVFMNVKMNQKIINIPEVKKAYFQPSAGDDSLIIGAAAKSFIDNNIELKPINSMYLGSKYSNEEVKNFLEKNNYYSKYKIEYLDDIEKEIAKLLANFNIVARFKGAGEWGARSLCNRAILGNASELKTFYEVNDMIKMRDFWMPFAPTILDSWADKYIKEWQKIKEKAFESTKFMILTCDSTNLAQKHLTSAIHQKDKTLRPQVVEKEDNKELYKLLKYYEELTGMGGIMNTSLNLHGYPLVGTLEQAIFTLENSGLKYMAIENFLIQKK